MIHVWLARAARQDGHHLNAPGPLRPKLPRANDNEAVARASRGNLVRQKGISLSLNTGAIANSFDV
jgi:hypothetical protein